MKKVIIIDDEPLARRVLKEFLRKFKDLDLVAECENGFEGAKAIESHLPDLIFLDVQMPKINGFEMLEIIDHNPSVIFTTAFDEYALKAFETNAIDYLLKPFSEERFTKSIEKWRENNGATNQKDTEIQKQPDEQNRIVLKEKGDIQIIPTKEIFYLEAYDDYVKIHTEYKYYLKKKTMNHYEKALTKKDFIRIHRSYIININYLSKIIPFEKNSHHAILVNKAQIPISRTAYPNLKEILGV